MDDFRHFSSLLSANPPPPLSSVARVKGRNGNDRFYGNDVWAKVGGYKYPAAGGRLLQYGTPVLLALECVILGRNGMAP